MADLDEFQAGELVPLSWQQRVIWYQSMLDPESPRYHYHALFHFEHPPEPAALTRSLRRLALRHRVLLTRLAYRTGEPWQVYPAVADADTLCVHEVRLAEVPSTRADLVADAGANRVFDLTSGPLVRWTLVRLPGGDATLIHTEHHLVHDGLSFLTLVESLSEDKDDGGGLQIDDGYFRYSAGQNPGLHPASAVVAEEFADESVHRLSRHRCGTERDPALRLPVPAMLVASARTAAKAIGVSLFTMFFTAFADAVHRAYGPVVLGTAVSNRPPGHDRTVGMFVSTVPVLIATETRMSPQAVGAAIANAVQRSDVPITDVMSVMRTEGSEQHGLVSVALSLHEQRGGPVSVAGTVAELEVGISPGAAKFPINVVVLVSGPGQPEVTVLLDGQADYVDHDQLWGLWTDCVASLRELCDLPVTVPETAGVVPDIFHAIRHIAEVDVDRIAVRDEVARISYAELVGLGDHAGQWAGGLVVGLLGSPSARLFAVAYAVVQAGGTYVPLDARQPAERLVHMVRQSGCQVVVDFGESATSSQFTGVITLSWDEFRSQVPSTEDSNWSDVAYVMFTSGSTGTPKGVRVRRTSLALLCDWAVMLLDLRSGTVTSQIASIGFDAAVLELWPALYAGAELIIAPESVRGDPDRLAHWLRDSAVEVAFVPTPVAEMLMALSWPTPSALRVLAAGGDQLHPPGKALPFNVINLYGPTECTVVSTAQVVDPCDATPAPIGISAPYCTVAVVAEDGSPVSDGSIGELWLGGGGLAAGYVAAPELTQPRFVPNPHSRDGQIVYRTGDLVRRAADGTLTFCGRRDRQVKISGARIELAEVEATALRHAEVRHAVAVTHIDERNVRRLSLVIVPLPGADEPVLAEHIRASLPTYLRHIAIRFVPRLPLDSNGKANLTMLSEPGRRNEEARRGALALARSMLGTDELDQSWFSSGGSSLDAARLVSRLNNEVGVSATVRELLEAAAVSEYLSRIIESTPAVAVDDWAQAHGPDRASNSPRTAPPESAPLSAVDVLWPSVSKLPPDEKLRLANMLVGAASADIWPGRTQ